MTTTSGMPEWWTRLGSEDSGSDAATAGQQTTASASQQAMLLSLMGYFWWMALGGVSEILFGGIYLGPAQGAGIHVNNPLLQLYYVLFGLAMITLAQGILRLEAWTVWVTPILGLGLAAVSAFEIYRWVTGTPTVVQQGIFYILNVVFALYAVSFVLQPNVRRTARYAPFRSGHFSPPMTIFVVVLALPALSVSVLMIHVDDHLSAPVSALVFVLSFVLMIVMAYGALKLQTWAWVAAWAWSAALTALSVEVIVRSATGGNVAVEGLIVSIVNLLFVVNVGYYLLRLDVRRAFIHARSRHALFSPPMVIGGLTLAVFALVTYLLPGVFGAPAIAYAVLGLTVGAVVGMLPDSDPVAQVMGFMVGLLLALASYVVRGGFLPYTKWSSAVVVLLLLVIITGIAALFRSTAWFVSMLLGAGLLFGVSELAFQKAPSAYAISAVLLESILFSFGLGFMVSTLLGLKMVRAPKGDAPKGDAAPSEADPATPTAGPTRGMPAAAGPTPEGDTATYPVVAKRRGLETDAEHTQRESLKREAS